MYLRGLDAFYRTVGAVGLAVGRDGFDFVIIGLALLGLAVAVGCSCDGRYLGFLLLSVTVTEGLAQVVCTLTAASVALLAALLFPTTSTRYQ